jgi:hypothetical protein
MRQNRSFRLKQPDLLCNEKAGQPKIGELSGKAQFLSAENHGEATQQPIDLNLIARMPFLLIL